MTPTDTASLDLAAIEARASQATAGPWEHGPGVLSALVVWSKTAGDALDDREVIAIAKLGPMSVRELDAAFIAHARADIPALLAALRSETARADEAERETERLEKLVYVPGLWRCAKCKMSLVSNFMHAESGRFAANNEPQDCPNGCGPLWRVTERDAGNDIVDRAEQASIEIQTARKTLAGTDAESLPHDYALERMATDRMADLSAATSQRDRLAEALREARRLVAKWCHTQGNQTALFDTYIGPIDVALDDDEQRNWPEDFPHENGNYMHTCHSCRQVFLGHKRRITCKLCASPARIDAALSEEKNDG